MIRFGVTGYSGFIGAHFRMFARDHVDVETILIPRSAFENLHTLTTLVAECDVVIHLAAVNQGTDEEIYATNIQLAQNIMDACRAASVKPHILFSSSIYADSSREVPVGRSKAFGSAKKMAEDLFIAWGKETGTKITVFRLPHVFGEMAKPHHNSVVATFCHQIVRGENSVINTGTQVELIYAGEVISRLYRAVHQQEYGVLHISGVTLNVHDVYQFLKECMKEYREGNMPLCSSSLHVALFLTLHSHILLSYIGHSELQ